MKIFVQWPYYYLPIALSVDTYAVSTFLPFSKGLCIYLGVFLWAPARSLSTRRTVGLVGLCGFLFQKSVLSCVLGRFYPVSHQRCRRARASPSPVPARWFSSATWIWKSHLVSFTFLCLFRGWQFFPNVYQWPFVFSTPPSLNCLLLSKRSTWFYFSNHSLVREQEVRTQEPEHLTVSVVEGLASPAGLRAGGGKAGGVWADCPGGTRLVHPRDWGVGVLV